MDCFCFSFFLLADVLEVLLMDDLPLKELRSIASFLVMGLHNPSHVREQQQQQQTNRSRQTRSVHWSNKLGGCRLQVCLCSQICMAFDLM